MNVWMFWKFCSKPFFVLWFHSTLIWFSFLSNYSRGLWNLFTFLWHLKQINDEWVSILSTTFTLSSGPILMSIWFVFFHLQDFKNSRPRLDFILQCIVIMCHTLLTLFYICILVCLLWSNLVTTRIWNQYYLKGYHKSKG